MLRMLIDNNSLQMIVILRSHIKNNSLLHGKMQRRYSEFYKKAKAKI